MSYQVGIDLGTTYTAAAVYRDDRASIFSLGGRSAAIPSVVLLREDETVLTGDAAVRRAMTEPERVAREFKRRLGDTTPIIVGGSPYSAEALMARLLRHVLDEVASREGAQADHVAVSHPANWGEYKHDLLRQAIQIANVDSSIVTLLSEPEAAAISYASQERVDPGEIVAVYDLGGGTFDAAVLRRTDDGFEIIGKPEGIERLGGIDFDAAVFAHVVRSLDGAIEDLDQDDPAVLSAVARLRQECVDAKEALSSDTDATIPVLLPGLQTEVRITRREFEGLIRPSLVDSIEALRRALRSAGVEAQDVSRVLLVGGSSRVPLISQMVSSELGRPVAIDAHPKHAIALGAAVAAATAAGGGAIGGTSIDSRPGTAAPPAAAAAPVSPPTVEPSAPAPAAPTPATPTVRPAGPPPAAAAPPTEEPATASPTQLPASAPAASAPPLAATPPQAPAASTAPPASSPPVGAPPIGPLPAGDTPPQAPAAQSAAPQAAPAGAPPASSPPASQPAASSAPGRRSERAQVAEPSTIPSGPAPGGGSSSEGNRTPLLIALGVVAAAVIGIGGFLATRGGGDDTAADDDGASTTVADVAEESTTTSESTTTTTEAPRTDADIQSDVQTALAPFAQDDLSASVANSVVTLTGTAFDDDTKAEIEAAALAVDGVDSVVAVGLEVLAEEFRCTDLIMSQPRWLCIDSAESDGTTLTVTFSSEDGGETFSVASGFHVHFFDGNTDPVTAGAAGDASTGGGNWQVWDLTPLYETGQFASSEVICGRIATGRHTLESLDSGNCWPVTMVDPG